jgi:hypothetical protein
LLIPIGYGDRELNNLEGYVIDRKQIKWLFQ